MTFSRYQQYRKCGSLTVPFIGSDVDHWSMIQDARVLQDDFLPREVVHREQEMEELVRALKPIQEGKSESGETALLTGPSGAGKTCLAKYSAGELKQELFDVETHYVDCWRHHTRFSALYQVLNGINRTMDIHRRSTPTDELLDRLHEHDEMPYVVVLDEVDQLDDLRLLYDLNSVRNLTTVLIANRREAIFSQVDQRVTSRIRSARHIRFDSYTQGELVSILEDRVKKGLREDSIDQTELEQIARIADGDARVAIGVLRQAARTAWEDSQEKITSEVIEDAAPIAREDVRQRNLDKLTEHQRVLYDSITEAGSIGMGDLYQDYESSVEEPKTKRSVRNDLQKMDQYGLIKAEGENRGRTYQVK